MATVKTKANVLDHFQLPLGRRTPCFRQIRQILHKNPAVGGIDVEEDENVLTFDEFKEYHVLNVIGRAQDFTENLARDFQFTAVLQDKLRSGK